MPQMETMGRYSLFPYLDSLITIRCNLNIKIKPWKN